MSNPDVNRGNTSKDYDRLYDLVVNHNAEVPAIVDYSFMDSNRVFRDFCRVRFDGECIVAGARGIEYFSSTPFCVIMCDTFSNVKDVFIKDCQNLDLEFYDGFD